MQNVMVFVFVGRGEGMEREGCLFRRAAGLNGLLLLETISKLSIELGLKGLHFRVFKVVLLDGRHRSVVHTRYES